VVKGGILTFYIFNNLLNINNLYRFNWVVFVTILLSCFFVLLLPR